MTYDMTKGQGGFSGHPKLEGGDGVYLGHTNLLSEEDEDFKSETDTTGTTNIFTEENSDTSTLTDLDYFSFKNSGDLDLSYLTSKKYSGNGTDVEKKTKKRKSLRWRRLRLKHWEKSMQESYYEDYADNKSVR